MNPGKGGQYALISVTDKTGIDEFARGLVELGYTILSTGGSAKALMAAGVPVTEIASFTGSPEIFDGRVKTLHPKIHGGILFDRNNPTHIDQASSQGITPISVVAVNLYDFQTEALTKRLPSQDAIHYIDIGGPAMLRAAAKNFAYCLVVSAPSLYASVLNRMRQGTDDHDFRLRLAADTFALISRYDQMIAASLAGSGPPDDSAAYPPSVLCLSVKRALTLRYGENPHQAAAFYTSNGELPMEILHGMELSFNNLLDLDAAISLARDCRAALDRHTISIVKHNTPCGVALARSPSEALGKVFQRAFDCDSKSAFGGIVACTQKLTLDAAESMVDIFLECIIAPDFEAPALALLKTKKKLRLIRSAGPHLDAFQLRSCLGGVLAQSPDLALACSSTWKPVTKHLCTETQLADLVLADVVAKHARSNAISFVKDLATIAIGSGQTSRIDSATFALQRGAQVHGDAFAHGAAMGSDAFFPFRDTIDFAATFGITAAVHPGGSVRDEESVAAANEHGIALYTSGQRHFRH